MHLKRALVFDVRKVYVVGKNWERSVLQRCSLDMKMQTLKLDYWSTPRIF